MARLENITLTIKSDNKRVVCTIIEKHRMSEI